jgi:hypothetical protein
VKTDFYNIQKTYENQLVNEMELKYTPVEDTKNSMKLGHSTMGPGNDAVQPNELDAPQFNDIVMYPKNGELSNEAKRKLLINFLDEEIVKGTWDDEVKDAFARLLYVLL